ncbi:Mu transposase C-terminal domain-containing protein [Vibrio plantisponsor]|uniref:Mu transposase C-terminal domain-containing protein n=1 Tax=Vibrio plantisponsor TaxID=664643 RepID=A0ABU4IGW7_9VIBR|nr:Mu transposase C-terminal domain-containing protein [Vibrio plantisponsor]MDW6017543.1 Mu transposase C-terminal domain-containing protein [Vibrio plantisponsor]
MSGVDEPLDSDSSLFGFVDEFIEENVDPPSQNVNQFFNSIDNHFKPSFDTLPSELQQQALARLDILNYVEKRLSGGWTERNLSPLLSSYKSETGKWVPTWRVFVEWKSAYFQSGRDIFSLAPKHKQKGNRTKKSDSQLLVHEAINKKYLTKERLSVAEVFEYYKSRVIEENRNNPDGKIKPISKRTFYNRINELQPYDVAAARYGKRYADREFKMVDHIRPATYPMEYVEIDHTPAPVILLDDELNLPLGRPYLTILYDRYSDCIVGLYVGFRDPSYESVRSAFLNATLKKDWVKRKFPAIEHDWPCHGKVTYLVVDNGAEFWSQSLESALKPLVSDIIYTKAAKPWEKPHVEKAFDSFYKLLFSRLPGKTFNNITELKDYDPKKDAVVRVSVFLELLYKWVIDYFHMKPDSKERRIPYHKWHDSKWRPNFYDGIEAKQLKIELGILNTRTLGKDGIRIHNLRYDSEELVAYKKRSAKANKKGATLKVKTDPDDISHIYVYLEEDKQYLKVPVIKNSGHIEGVSLYQHERICAVKRLNTRLQKNEESLADTYLYIDRRIDGEVERISNNKQSRSTKPKTTNLSKIAKYKKVGSEGPVSIANKQVKNKIPPTLDVSDTDDLADDIDLSDIDGY